MNKIGFWWVYGRHSKDKLNELRITVSLALYLARMRGDTEYIEMFETDLINIQKAQMDKRS